MFQYKRKFAKWPWPLDRAIVELVKYPWTQLTFKGNVAHEEVRNYTVNISGNTVENERLKSPNTHTPAYFPQFAPKRGEDFTIELKFNVKTQGSTFGTLLTAWSGTSNSSWRLTRDTDGKINFLTASETGLSDGGVSLTSAVAVPPNLDTHVAIVRRNNVIAMYINGQRQNQTLENNQGFYATPNVTTGALLNQWMEGERWDIRFCRYAAYTEDFNPESLKFFARPLYDDYSDILVQSLLSDKIINEVARSEASINKASLTYGTISFQNHNDARVGFPLTFEGTGDFTLETGFRFDYVSSSGTIQVFGFGALALRINGSRKLSCIVYPSWPSTSSPVEVGVSNIILEYRVDYHIALERVADVISVYVDGNLAFSFNYSAPVPSSELYFTTTYGSPTPTRFVWNIRVSKKAMYNGNITYNNFYPRIPFDVDVLSVRYQPLVTAAFNAEQTHHNIESIRYQVLVKV